MIRIASCTYQDKLSDEIAESKYCDSDDPKLDVLYS